MKSLMTKIVTQQQEVLYFLQSTQTYNICNMIKDLGNNEFSKRLKELDKTKIGKINHKDGTIDSYDILRNDVIGYVIINKLRVRVEWKLI